MPAKARTAAAKATPARTARPARSRAATQKGALRVTWVRSEIGHKEAARSTIRALGLHRLHQTVDVADTPENRGMLRRVAFLLRVEGAEAEGSR